MAQPSLYSAYIFSIRRILGSNPNPFLQPKIRGRIACGFVIVTKNLLLTYLSDL